MWWFLWRYVIVPVLVWLLTQSVADRRRVNETEHLRNEKTRLERVVEDLRERLKRRDEDDRRPFRPWRDPAADPRGLPAEVIGEQPELNTREGL